MKRKELIDNVENKTIKNTVYFLAIIIPGIFYIYILNFIEFKLFGILNYFSIIHIIFEFTFFYLCFLSFRPMRNILLNTFFKKYILN